MRDRNWLPMVMALVLVSTGCATQREWTTWRAHPTHFATDNHLGFSVTNAVAGAPRITPELMAQAKGEGWWGRNIPSDVQLADVAGHDRADPPALSRQGGVGWTMMVRMAARYRCATRWTSAAVTARTAVT